jgi:hypothetical protein
MACLPACLREVDATHLAAATGGFSGADLKRLVEDGKALFAYDRARGEQQKAPTEYFVAAIEAVRANKERYAQAEARAKGSSSSIDMSRIT